MESRTLELCADDFGLDSGISSGILKLVCLKRLSSVSCMVNMPDFAVFAPELRFLKKQIKIGLHFNLTEGYLVSDPDKRCFQLNELVIKTHLRSVTLSFIAKEFLAQLNQFIQLMHQPPDFIDGHQHVHQFPGVRQVILELYEQKFKGSGCSIRSTWPCVPVPQYRFKANILGLTGGKQLHRQLVELKIPHNDFFSGIYDFSPQTNYRDLFRKWLRLVKKHTLIMCHPREDESSRDVIAPARLKEMNYFLSDEFLADCEEHQVLI